jgi:hypothetical protein
VKSGNHKLAKQIGQLGFFAEVTVSFYGTVDGPAIHLAETAKRSEFGEAAVRGVRYALAHSEPAVDLSVTGISITSIEDFPVDTTPPAVEFAACYATWKATDRKPTREPRFEGVKIVFED